MYSQKQTFDDHVSSRSNWFLCDFLLLIRTLVRYLLSSKLKLFFHDLSQGYSYSSVIFKAVGTPLLLLSVFKHLLFI